MTNPERLITNCYPIIDTLGNVILLPYENWYEIARQNRDRMTVYGKGLTLQQLNKFMSEYRKGHIKLGDEYNG